MGNVIVADNLDNARAIAKALYSRYRIVTLESDVINAGGSMTGGATKRNNNAGLLSRKTDIDHLSQEIKTLTATVTNLQEEMHQASQVSEEMVKELETIKAQGDEARFSGRTLTSQIEQLTGQIADLTEALKTGESLQASASKTKAKQEKAKAKLEADLKVVDDQVNQLKNLIEDMNLSATDKAEKRAQLQGQLQTKPERFVFPCIW